MVAVPADISEKELLEIIEKEAYSRIPVYEENIDDIIGILYVKDYLLKHGEENFSIKDVLLPPEFVPETVHLDSLFKDMQDNHMHMAIVVNEYGLALGVVTMEDIIEELVGEIWDEQDEAVESIVKTGDNTYRVLSSVSIDEFFDFFELPKDESIESTTVNGWLTERFDGIPEVGQSFEYENLSIAVTVADEQMSHEVQVTILEPNEQEGEEEKAEEKEKA